MLPVDVIWFNPKEKLEINLKAKNVKALMVIILKKAILILVDNKIRLYS